MDRASAKVCKTDRPSVKKALEAYDDEKDYESPGLLIKLLAIFSD